MAMQVETSKVSVLILMLLVWATFFLSGCGQYVMATKLNEFENAFDQRLRVAKEELSSGKVQMTYQDQIEIKGGIPPYRWQMLDGQLPEGLTLDSSTGQVMGVPKASEVKVIVVEVSDASNANGGGTLIRSFVLKVD